MAAYTKILTHPKAAEQGDAYAQSNLGFMYKNGEGVEADKSEAFKWFRKAAEQGKARHQHNVGVMYYNGDGVDHDLVKAIQWWRRAAAQGYADAQSKLGAMYTIGGGVEKDLDEALKWTRKAADQGFAEAQANLDIIYAAQEAERIARIETEKRRKEEEKYRPKSASEAKNEWLAFRGNEDKYKGTVTTWKCVYKNSEQSSIFGGPTWERSYFYLDGDYNRPIKVDDGPGYGIGWDGRCEAWDKIGKIHKNDLVAVTGKFTHVTEDGELFFKPIRLMILGYGGR